MTVLSKPPTWEDAGRRNITQDENSTLTDDLFFERYNRGGNPDLTKIVTLVFSFSLLQPFEIVMILQDDWVF